MTLPLVIFFFKFTFISYNITGFFSQKIKFELKMNEKSKNSTAEMLEVKYEFQNHKYTHTSRFQKFRIRFPKIRFTFLVRCSNFKISLSCFCRNCQTHQYQHNFCRKQLSLHMPDICQILI